VNRRRFFSRLSALPARNSQASPLWVRDALKAKDRGWERRRRA
jgi:hypothetical protein